MTGNFTIKACSISGKSTGAALRKGGRFLNLCYNSAVGDRKIVYERLEHKADTGLLVRAPSLERLYIDAALALTDSLVTLDAIEEKLHHHIQVSADSRETLMVRWLNEILFLFEHHKFLSRRIVFDGFDDKRISATATGDTYNPSKHGHVSEVKAVTYHQLELGDAATPEPHFYARIFLDL